MSDQTYQLAALAIYFAAMLAIGFYAYRRTDSHEDYMLAGRDLPPWAAALSAGASDMSGWLMMGLPGAIYVAGLIEAWIAIGLSIGAYLNWRFVAPRLRAYTEVSRNSITIPSFLENRLRDTSRLLRVASGVIILVFFTFYVSSGMVAGGVFFESSFDSDYLLGMALVAGVTLLYTLFGGFLGASLTDVVQGLMMMIALLIVPVMAIVAVGGPVEAFDAVRDLEPGHLSLFGGTALTATAVVGIISALGWGLGYFGQPHIIVRFMALRDPSSATAARRIGMGWMILSLLGAVVGGLVGVAYFAQAETEVGDPETVMLTMSQILLHPIVAGFVLAAVLAAVMSTVSSQLIVCSSALVEDLYKVVAKSDPSSRTLVTLGRACVLAVAVIAALLALNPDGTILSLVGFAWAGFGASFGPVILLSLFWRKLTNWGALTGMVAGAVTVFAWDAWGTDLYEIVPGFLVNLVVAVVVSRLTYQRDEEIEQEFDATVKLVQVREATAS
ncbi:sodium/proline symporter PutP [Aeromicrobium camelliae]|uniref:Sodium/proline symporter n=1 Tax=Aeromicrobium camelliae TaxID=1538144 RepID=A0A3N6ZBZ8_9ACTN|nr:sodium/proline symporter PutP [Aeromicrobium camelliae]RQN07721.1 sodium/proline symporter PutP [Aeromicrobium camelliae]